MKILFSGIYHAAQKNNVTDRDDFILILSAFFTGCYNPGGSRVGSDSLRDLSDGGISVVDLDVTDESSVKAARSVVEEQLSKSGSELSCLVNNAAVLTFGEVEWQPVDMVRRQFEVNVIGSHIVTKAFLPLLRKGENARIVNMVSFCTDCPLPMLSVYTATKAALKSYSAGLRMEMRKFGIHVVLFNPGDHPEGTPLCAGQVICI